MMKFLSFVRLISIRRILRREGKHAKVVILGTNGMGFKLLELSTAERHCDIIAVTDDFRAKKEKLYYQVPLITTEDLSFLAKQHPNLIAINTCENPKAKNFFDNFCKKNYIKCMSYRQAERTFPKLIQQRNIIAKQQRLVLYRQAGDWILSHLGRWKFHGRHMALIRLDGAGDFILWLDSARHIRHHYSEYKITLFANSSWADYAASLPYWDRVIAVNLPSLNQDFLYRWKMMLKIWASQYNIVINPTFYRSYLETECLVRASSSSQRIGWNCNIHPRLTDIQKLVADTWYTKLFTSSFPIPHASEILRNTEFVSLLIEKNITPAIHKLPRQVTKAIKPDHDYCILFPGASWEGRRWPINHFIELGKKIQNKFNLTIVLCGTKNEESLCDLIEKSMAIEVLNFAGKTTFSEFIELIRGAKILISNDTSAIHIAPAVDTPSVCILGGGHYGMFLPYPENIPGIKPLPATKKMECYGCEWDCSLQQKPHDAVPCVGGVTVDDVFGLVGTALDKNYGISISMPEQTINSPISLDN